MAERRSSQSGADQRASPLEQARRNPAVQAGLLRSLAAKLRGEKPVRATELMELMNNDEDRRSSGGP
jgi:hypothetical protein